jgi:hypothetical protein
MDNFVADIMTYIPYFIYALLLSKVSYNSVIKIVKYGISLTVVSLIISYVFGRTFEYGNAQFLISNSLYFILPVAVLLLRKQYPKWQQILMIFCVLLFSVMGKYFISGKTIVILLLFLAWTGRHKRMVFLPVLILLGITIVPLLMYLSRYYQDSVIGFKFLQVYNVFNYADIMYLASRPDSIGNIFAEGLTVYRYLLDSVFFLFVGKGFGGGTQDVFGFLSHGAGAYGYAFVDKVRNDYHKMHLPIFEIVLKSGIIGLSYYLYILIKNFMTKNKYGFIYFILIL